MHPNCRHDFLPFAAELERPEVIEKLIKESKEFHYLKNTMGEQMPYQTMIETKGNMRDGVILLAKKICQKRLQNFKN